MRNLQEDFKIKQGKEKSGFWFGFCRAWAERRRVKKEGIRHYLLVGFKCFFLSEKTQSQSKAITLHREVKWKKWVLAREGQRQRLRAREPLKESIFWGCSQIPKVQSL